MLEIGIKFDKDMKLSLGERLVFNSFELGCLCAGAGVNGRSSPDKIVERMKVMISLWKFEGFLLTNEEWFDYLKTAIKEWGYEGDELQSTIENIVVSEKLWMKALDDGWKCNVAEKSDKDFVLTIAKKVFDDALGYGMTQKYFEEFEEEEY
jgi:hypothetical protein